MKILAIFAARHTDLYFGLCISMFPVQPEEIKYISDVTYHNQHHETHVRQQSDK